MSASVFSPAMVLEPPRLSRSSSGHRRLNPTTKKKTTMSTVKFVTVWRNPLCEPGAKQSFRIGASDRQREKSDYGTDEPRDDPGIQEDLNYLWKLGAGSVAAATVIKYGSVFFRDITTPNLTLALFMIFAPVVISVILLIRSSYSKKS